MLELGRTYTATVECLDKDGAWCLIEGERLLLPQREVPEDLEPGDSLTGFAFQYQDDCTLLTLRPVQAEAGQFAALKVQQVTRHGAFLAWGPPKDILAPFSEQPERMKMGETHLVKICLDEEGRLFATARIDLCLEWDETSLQSGDEVDCLLWQLTPLGAKVILNDLYPAIVYKEDLAENAAVGDRHRATVRQVREDGKIDVTLRKVGREARTEATDVIRQALAADGFLPLHDKSNPEEIQQQLGLSKKLFKKAVGILYKGGEIELVDQGIRRKEHREE